MPDENTAEGDSAAKAEEAPTANGDPPASSGGPSTDRAAIQVVEGVNQKQASARLGVTAYENEEGGGVEKYHSDLDAYRNARRMSRASSRLDQTHLEGHADLSQEGQDTSPRSAELTEKEKKAQERQGAPTCLINLTERIEACTESIQAWTDRQEENARRKKQEKAEAAVVIKEDGTVIEPQGESWLQRNIIVFVVFIILSWVYIVFVWRICALGIRRVPIAVTTRTEGVGLLIGFNILWLMTIWAYIRVTLAGPGLVRDHVAISDPPKPPSSAPEVVEGPVSNINTESTDVQRNRAVAHDAEVAAIARTKQASESQPSEERVQPTLPAFAGPLVAGEAAKRDEEKAMSSVQGSGIAPSSLPVQPFYQQHQPVMTEDGIPEPMRIPSHQAPLHPTNLYCYRCKRVKPPRSHHCRRCATCVLKMDHHCPWVGGCVGAQNHKFFYHFLQWVTALESYVLITNAVLFTRGIARRSVGGPGWPIDGYMISLFPITAMFTLFTTALLITHTYLFILNLTTIEHMAYDRMKTREEILLERYLDARKDSRGKALSFREKVQEKRRMRKKWAVQWGNLKSEANLFWLDDEQSARTSGKARHWYQSIGPNWTQILGKSWYQWFLPLGKPDKDVGLAYDTNWRFGESGRWRMREEWPKAA